MSDDDDASVVHHATHTVYQAVAHRTSQAEQEGRMICLDHDNDTPVHPPQDPYRFLQRRIYKEFPPHGWFFGTVQEIYENVEDDTVDYRILYDDEDTEDMLWEELRNGLEQWERNQSQDVVWQKQLQEKKQQEEAQKKKRQHSDTIRPVTILSTPPRIKKVKQERVAAVTPSPPKKARLPPAPFIAADYIDQYNLQIPWICDMALWLQDEESLR